MLASRAAAAVRARRRASSKSYDLVASVVFASTSAFEICGAERFLDWAFEAFDGEEWRRLLHSRTSPWPGGFYLGGDGAVVFQLWYPFASTRFRIRLLEPALSMHAHRCMHIRGLELYGTIMPPWRID